MNNFKEIAKARIEKGLAKASAADDPGNGKTAEELKKDLIEKELLENRAAMEALKEKEVVEPFKENTTKPMKDPVFKTCPGCGEEFTAQGIGRHIKAIHKVQGIPLEDLDRVNQGEITLPDLLDEKGITTIYGLSPEIEKKYFSNWGDKEEDPEDPEGLEDPEEIEDPEDLEDPEKEAKENGAGGVLPLIFIIGIPAAIILSKIPKFKEIGDKLLAALGDLGSKKSPDPRQAPGTNFSSWNRRF